MKMLKSTMDENVWQKFYYVMVDKTIYYYKSRHNMPRVLTPTRAEKLEAEWSTRLPTPKALPADEETKEVDLEEASEPVSAMPPPPCFCSQCGAPLRGRFCGQCGARAA